MNDLKALTSCEWVHSHEEDGSSESGRFKQFRPAHFDFPRSRGRTAYHFYINGKVERTLPGAIDRRSHQQGSWELSDSDRIALDFGDVRLELKIEELNGESMRLSSS